jgi:GMP reductase
MSENSMSENIYLCKFESMDKYLDFKDVLILPKKSNLNSRKEVSLERTIFFQNGLSWTGIPIVAANMTTIGTLDVYKVLSSYKIITALHKFHKLQDLLDYNKDNSNCVLNPDYFMISTGISSSDYKNLTHILDNFECKFICIDIANGYISNFSKFCKHLRSKYPEKIILAGNICTSEGIDLLNDAKIDIHKIGIGGGSACTTRIQTGVGMPQLSCILECVQACKESNRANFLINYEYDQHKENKSFVLSDGGISCPGDLAKAFSAGADFVMIGGEFAGHDENPGQIVIDEKTGNKYKLFYGMSSTYAMKNNYAANNNTNYRSSEGRELKVLYKGALKNTIENYLGGLRSTCTYTNSANLEELASNTKFICVNNQYNSHLL